MKMEAGARIYKAHGTASGVSQPASLQMTLTRKRHCVSCSLRLRHVTREMKSLSGAYKDSEKRRSETKTGSWCILSAWMSVLLSSCCAKTAFHRPSRSVRYRRMVCMAVLVR